jgi:hypothetical protein
VVEGDGMFGRRCSQKGQGRSSERWETSLPGRYRFVDDPNARWHDCRVVNLSFTGAALDVFGPVPGPDQKIMVELLPDGAMGVHLFGKVNVVGEVRHNSHAQGVPWRSRIGLQFAQISPIAQSILTDVLVREWVSAEPMSG